MNLQALKKDILHRIIETENEDTLLKISHVLNVGKKDFWDDLTENQRKEVEIGLKQIESGETEDWEDFFERASINKGISEADNGDLKPHSEAKKIYGKWL